MSEQEHAAVLLERLRTFNPAAALNVLDDKVTNGTQPPYLLARFSLRWLGPTDRPDVTNLADVTAKCEVTTRLYAVGESADAARILIDHGSAAFLNWRPVVPGRVCHPMRHDDSFYTPPDERTGIAYHESGATWTFLSSPAT